MKIHGRVTARLHASSSLLGSDPMHGGSACGSRLSNRQRMPSRFTTFEGSIGVNDVLRYARLLVEDPDFAPHFDQLADLRRADKLVGWPTAAPTVARCSIRSPCALDGRSSSRTNSNTACFECSSGRPDSIMTTACFSMPERHTPGSDSKGPGHTRQPEGRVHLGRHQTSGGRVNCQVCSLHDGNHLRSSNRGWLRCRRSSDGVRD